MKKIILFSTLLLVLLTGCFETETDTTVSKDGSGSITAVVDFSSMMKMLMAMKESKSEKKEQVDTTIYFRSFTDTASSLTARQKELLQDMKVSVKMDSETGDFRMSVNSPFKNLKDLNELNVLMTEKEYDGIFDKAMSSSATFGNDVKPSTRENDNMFGSLFPNFFDCVYANGLISCTVNKEKYAQALEEMKKMEMDVEGEMAEQMLGGSKFTNRINLPAKAKKITGESVKPQGMETTLVQTGTVLDLYKHPEKYAYRIEY